MDYILLEALLDRADICNVINIENIYKHSYIDILKMQYAMYKKFCSLKRKNHKESIFTLSVNGVHPIRLLE